MVLHSVGNPQFEMLNAAKNLRSYAGVLPAITTLAPKAPENPTNPTRPKLPCKRIERTPSPQKRSRKINRAALTV